MRQLEAIKESIDNQKIIIQQVLSKFPIQVIIKLEESKSLEESWSLTLVRKSLQHYITVLSNAQHYEANARFAGGNMRNINPHKSEKGECLHTDTFVTNSSVGKYKGKGHEAIRSCIYCKGEHFTHVINMLLLLIEGRSYKNTAFILFVLELVMCPNNVQMFH